jgi:hypothetical protein
MFVNIYCIEDCDGLKYVGSTLYSLLNRLKGHKRKNNNCSSKKLKLDTAKIYLLEKCDRKYRAYYEAYYIDTIDCVNILSPMAKSERHSGHYQRYLEWAFEKSMGCDNLAIIYPFIENH